MEGHTRSPTTFLNSVIGQNVVVKLNSGIDYKGVLACLDGYMNIALENTEEYVDGKLKNKYGDTFVRGNNAQTSRDDTDRIDDITIKSSNTFYTYSYQNIATRQHGRTLSPLLNSYQRTVSRYDGHEIDYDDDDDSDDDDDDSDDSITAL